MEMDIGFSNGQLPISFYVITMTQSPQPPTPTPETPTPETLATPSEPAPSYVKLAMRNMVKKGGKSLFHFFLTAAGLLGVLIGLAYLTR